MLLFRAFQEYEEKGIWDEKLEELYREGKQHVSIFFLISKYLFFLSGMLFKGWKPPGLPQSPTPTPLQSVQTPNLAYMNQTMNGMNMSFGLLSNGVLQTSGSDVFRGSGQGLSHNLGHVSRSGLHASSEFDLSPGPSPLGRSSGIFQQQQKQQQQQQYHHPNWRRSHR